MYEAKIRRETVSNLSLSFIIVMLSFSIGPNLATSFRCLVPFQSDM